MQRGAENAEHCERFSRSHFELGCGMILRGAVAPVLSGPPETAKTLLLRILGILHTIHFISGQSH